MSDCWFQCCNDQCKKWRCVDPAVVDMLRGVEFLRPEVTDLDWQLWLSDARTRYAGAQQRSGVTDVVVPLGLGSVGLDVGDVPPVADAVTPDVDDGAVTPEAEDRGRTPSDGEVASEGDNPDAADGSVQGHGQGVHCSQLSQLALPQKQRRLYAANTVKPLAARRAKTFAVVVVSFWCGNMDVGRVVCGLARRKHGTCGMVGV